MKPMSFKLCHDPEKKTLTIPRASLQLSGLADAEELTIHAGESCILLVKNDLSTRDAAKALVFLNGIISSLADQLEEKSSEMASRQAAFDDPLDEFDDAELATLDAFDIDLDGLRMLLAAEEMDDE